MPTCLLCGEREATREHAPPKWTKKAFLRRNPDRDPDAIGATRRGRSGPARHFSDWTDAPCDECRVWWNKHFEDRLRKYIESLLFGEQVVVPQSEVAAVATWIMYQAMVRAIALEDGESVEPFPPEDFRYIREHGHLPEGHLLWIGCRSPALKSLTADPSIPGWSYEPDCPGSWSVLFSLVCRHHHDAPDADTAVNEGEADGSLVRLWPWVGGDLSWPPPTPITEGTLSKVANAN